MTTPRQTPELTKWDGPGITLNSVHGPDITYRKWCEIERDRINSRGGGDQVKIAERTGHKRAEICLSR